MNKYFIIFLIILIFFIFKKLIYEKGYIKHSIYWYINKYEKLIDQLRNSNNMIEFQEISVEILKLKNILNKKFSKKELNDAILFKKHLASKLQTQFLENIVRMMPY